MKLTERDFKKFDEEIDKDRIKGWKKIPESSIQNAYNEALEQSKKTAREVFG